MQSISSFVPADCIGHTVNICLSPFSYRNQLYPICQLKMSLQDQSCPPNLCKWGWQLSLAGLTTADTHVERQVWHMRTEDWPSTSYFPTLRHPYCESRVKSMEFIAYKMHEVRSLKTLNSNVQIQN